MQKLTVLVVLPLTFEFVFVALLAGLLLAADADSRRLEAAKGTQSACADVIKNLYKTTAAAYMYPVQKDELSRIAYEDGRTAFPDLLDRLQRSCGNDPRTVRSAEMVLVLSGRLLRELESIVETSAPTAAYIGRSETVAKLDHQILDQCAQIAAVQSRVQSYRRTRVNWQVLIGTVLGCGLLSSLVASIMVLRYIHFDLVSRILVMVDNTRRVTSRTSLNQLVGGTDEIAELDGFIHDMSDAIEESENRRKEFVSMLTHDMRAPLTQVFFFLGMLSDGRYENNPVKLKTAIQKLFPEIARLTRLIEDMLTLDKIDVKELALMKEQVNVSKLVNEVKDALDSEAEGRSKNIICEVIDREIIADVFQIKRVLVNLCSNALKYSSQKSTVEIHCSEGDDEILFEVMDDGPGLVEEVIPTIFERYKQGNECLSRQGFGLGLHIARLIVEAHGGRIGARNRTDSHNGAVFFFYLPLGLVTNEVDTSVAEI